MKVLLLVLVLFCTQCVAMRTENPVSDDAALHNPSGKMRLYAVPAGVGATANYCVILENNGKRELLTTRGSLTEKQLRKAVRYTSKGRLFWGWFPHSTAIGEGEKDETVFHMRFGDHLFFSAEEGLRISRSSALRDTSDEENIELTTRKIKIIIDRLRKKRPDSGRYGFCNNVNLEKNVPTP